MTDASAAAPGPLAVLGEIRALSHRFSVSPVPPAIDVVTQGAVVVLPGFMMHDVATIRLRRSLRAAGHDARGWGMGVNGGLRDDTFEALDRVIRRASADAGRPVALVGWSLGGLFAREAAKRRPDLVSGVVTMASPFSGDPRANNLWRIYERVTGHPVDAPPVPVRLSEKPPVPTVAVWARRDGLIAPACCRGEPGERDMEIGVDCGHCDVAVAPAGIRAAFEALDFASRASNGISPRSAR